MEPVSRAAKAEQLNSEKRKAKPNGVEAAKLPAQRSMAKTGFVNHVKKQLALSTEVAYESMKEWTSNTPSMTISSEDKPQDSLRQLLTLTNIDGVLEDLDYQEETELLTPDEYGVRLHVQAGKVDQAVRFRRWRIG